MPAKDLISSKTVPGFSLIAQVMLTSLLFVPNFPGVVYMGAGEYAVHLDTFARQLGYKKKHQERIHRAFRSMLENKQLMWLNYDDNVTIAHFKLRPLIDNFGDYKIDPELGRAGEHVANLMFKATKNRQRAFQRILEQAGTRMITALVTGFDNPDTWWATDRIAKAFKTKGRDGLTDRLPVRGTMYGDFTPWEYRDVYDQKHHFCPKGGADETKKTRIRERVRRYRAELKQRRAAVPGQCAGSSGGPGSDCPDNSAREESAAIAAV